MTLNEAVTVTGTPKLSLNDGGTATYSSGSGTSTLTFRYKVAAGQNTTKLAVTGVTLPSGASVMGAAGNAADFSGATARPERAFGGGHFADSHDHRQWHRTDGQCR